MAPRQRSLKSSLEKRLRSEQSYPYAFCPKWKAFVEDLLANGTSAVGGTSLRSQGAVPTRHERRDWVCGITLDHDHLSSLSWNRLFGALQRHYRPHITSEHNFLLARCKALVKNNSATSVAVYAM